MKTVEYKDTEVGRIPVDWEVVSLSDICCNCSYGVGAEAKAYNGKDKYIRITDIDDLSHRYIPSPLMSPAFFMPQHIVQINDILIARTGASVGKSYLYDESDGLLVFAGFLMRINICNANARYVAYCFCSQRYWTWVSSESARTGQPGLNLEQIKNFKIALPPIEEQNSISESIQAIDNTLNFLDKAIEKKRLVKEGLMQQLLTGKKRLPGYDGEWDTIQFKSLYKFAKEGGTPSTSVQEYYTPATIPFAKIEDLKDQNLVSVNAYISEAGLEHSSAWLIPINSVILSNGATLGEVAINRIPISTKQGILGIILHEQYCPEFIYYLFKGKEFKKEMERVTTHGTMDCAYLKDLNTIQFRVPTIEEQVAIATVLSAVDTEIQSMEAERDKYILIKQGMMQELLTGKTRLI